MLASPGTWRKDNPRSVETHHGGRHVRSPSRSRLVRRSPLRRLHGVLCPPDDSGWVAGSARQALGRRLPARRGAWLPHPREETARLRRFCLCVAPQCVVAPGLAARSLGAVMSGGNPPVASAHCHGLRNPARGPAQARGDRHRQPSSANDHRRVDRRCPRATRERPRSKRRKATRRSAVPARRLARIIRGWVQCGAVCA